MCHCGFTTHRAVLGVGATSAPDGAELSFIQIAFEMPIWEAPPVGLCR